MLDMNTLLAEILTGVGAAIFIGSLLALLRGRTPAGMVTRHASYRPRSVAAEQAGGDSGDEPGADVGGAGSDTGDEAGDVGDVGGAGGDAGDEAGADAGETDPDDPADAAATYRLYRTRTVFFLVVGFITTAWGIGTILTRG